MAAVLEFRGVYVKGEGVFSVIIQIPGHCDFTKSIEGWPAVMHEGTLNVKIDPDGFPQELISHFGSKSVKHFDSRRFRPEAEIPAHAIGGNTLLPTEVCPDKGNGQVWNANIIELKSQNSKDCWVFRRIGSGYGDVLELVAEESISVALSLKYGDPVTVLMYGTWADS
jgi:CTP-dependent riboflavin kinase